MPGYDAARSTAVVVDRSGEGRLRLTGADRVSWLQGLVTNDVAALQPGQGCYAAYLTPQGRMISDLRILATREALLLDVPTVARTTVAARFEQFIITEDVVVEDVTARVARLAVHGPAAAAVVASALDVPVGSLTSLAEHAHIDVEFQDAPVFVAGCHALGGPGFDLYCAAERVTDVAARLFAAGAQDITADAWDTLRIEAGLPLFGVDMDTETIPLEAGLEASAISQTKGCYVGQEVVIRILHRGGGRVVRRLVAWVADTESESDAVVPAAATPFTIDGKAIGRVTSAAWSPTLRRVIGLGYAHRDHTEPGTNLTIGAEPAVAVTVSTLPLVAMPAAAAAEGA
ncbi:MAG: glycine cleavage T C-terminal barrel domain-containing protein [Vicinamibacteraceae bacterium]